MNKNIFIVCTLVLFLTGCASSATRDIKIETDSDPRIKFAGYKTYGWLGSASILQDPDGRWEPPQYDADAEIRFLINYEMRTRGLTESSSKPDMIIFYSAGIDMANVEIEIDPESGLDQLTSHPIGALKVILIDRRSKRAIWAGIATGDVQQNPDRKSIRERIKYAIKSMFKKLPN